MLPLFPVSILLRILKFSSHIITVWFVSELTKYDLLLLQKYLIWSTLFVWPFKDLIKLPLFKSYKSKLKVSLFAEIKYWFPSKKDLYKIYSFKLSLFLLASMHLFNSNLLGSYEKYSVSVEFILINCSILLLFICSSMLLLFD